MPNMPKMTLGQMDAQRAQTGNAAMSYGPGKMAQPGQPARPMQTSGGAAARQPMATARQGTPTAPVAAPGTPTVRPSDMMRQQAARGTPMTMAQMDQMRAQQGMAGAIPSGGMRR